MRGGVSSGAVVNGAVVNGAVVNGAVVNGAAPVRSLVLWFPDWPVTALTRDASRSVPLDASLPIAVMAGNVVVACSAAARAEGVRRGQRRRDAQARCPRLTVIAADPVRDHRVFAPVVAGIEERAPGVQIVRPGLCALRARGPARYYGGETEAARVLLGALQGLGLEGVRACLLYTSPSPRD